SVSVYFVLFLHEALDLPLIAASGLLGVVSLVAIGGRGGGGGVPGRARGGGRRPGRGLIPRPPPAPPPPPAAAPPPPPPPPAPRALALLLAIMIGATAFSWTGIYGTLAIELAGPASAASAVAWVHLLGGVGSLGAAPLFGYVVDHTGSYRVAWLVVAAAVLV